MQFYVMIMHDTLRQFTLVHARVVHESWLSSLQSSSEWHLPSLESLLFLGAESRVKSRVISLESESSRVIAKFLESCIES